MAGMGSMGQEIRVKLGLETESAMSQLRGFSGKVDSAFTGLAGRLAGVFAVGAVAQWGRQILTEAGNLKDLAEQLDVTTTFLQRFQNAATAGGSTPEKATTALATLSRSLGEAKDPLSQAAKEFQKYGIQVMNADGSMRTVEQTVNAIADAMNANANAAERNKMAYDLLGKSGQSLVNALSGGSGGLRAGGVGAIFRESDIQRMERFDNLLVRISRGMKVAAADAVFGWSKILRGDFSSSVPNSKDIIAAARKRLFDEQELAQRGPSQEMKARKILEDYDKKHEESLRRQATLEKQKVADNAVLAELKQRQIAADSAAQALNRTLADRGRFTVEELAQLPGPFQRGALQVKSLEEQARFRIRFGGTGEDLFNRADAVRKTLTPLTEGERFPYQDLRENARKSSEELAKLTGLAQGYGIKIIPRNGP